MNELSWLLYLADVATNLKTLGIIFFCFAFIGILISCLFTALSNDINHEQHPYMNKFVKCAIPVIVVSSVLLTFIPEKKTIYLVITSEVGEEIVMNEEAREIFQKLVTKIKKELDE